MNFLDAIFSLQVDLFSSQSQAALVEELLEQMQHQLQHLISSLLSD